MSEEIKKKIEDINRAFEEFKTKNDQSITEAEKRGGTALAETREVVDRINADITELKKGLKDLEVRANRPNFGHGDAQPDPQKSMERRAFEKYLRYGFDAARITPDELRTLSGTSDADGGFLIPVDFDREVIKLAYDQAEIRPVCQVGTTGRDKVQLGALARPSVAWGSRNVAVTAQDLATGGQSIDIFDLKALVTIHNNTLDDAEADIWGEISMMFGDAIAEAEDDAFAVGAGDDSPSGIASNTSVQANYVLSYVAAALSDSTYNGVDALISCLYKPKKTYRRNATWAMNSTTESVVRKLKDSYGQYLWQPSTQAGTPASLLGRPIINPEGMADIGAGAFPIVCGDFRAGYKIRDRAGLTIKRLEERYAEYDQVGMIVKKRVGGKVVLAEAFACVKIAAS